MRRAGWTSGAAACMLGTLAFGGGTPGGVQGRETMRQDTVRTTMNGVFTDAQAQRGSDTYSGICLSCHTPSSETGDAFDKNWKDRPLSDLFSYIAQQMPQDNPGSLDPYAAADLTAYMLKLNNMPAGTVELAPDTLAMKTIRITRIQGPTP